MTADRWGSGRARTVLFVARTLQATARLYYDVLPLFGRDPNVQVHFVLDPTSEFGDRVPEFLTARHARVIDWASATKPGFRCDLVVSAGVNRNLAKLPKPLLVMSHGAGHHKYLATPDGVESTVAGLSPDQLTVDGEPVPTVIALGGPDQLAGLRAAVPSAADRGEVIGDVCAERLRLSRSQRRRYRAALGVQEGQKLILISSTWGPDSLLARHPRLADRLTRALPSDEYRFAMVLHPNAWDRHGAPSVASWIDAPGLMVIPPHEGWRAVLIASDVVIGDHGSLSFYAADLGVPVGYAAFSRTEIPTGTPAAALSEVVPRLDVDGDLADRIRDLVAESPDYTAITRRSLDETDSAATRLRTVLYRLLKLAEPDTPPDIAAFPVPEYTVHPATTHHVFTDDKPETVERYPASDADRRHRRPFDNRVLVVDATEILPSRRIAASVIVWTESPLSPGTAIGWCDEVLDELPGLGLAAAILGDRRLLIRSRQHGLFTVEVSGFAHPASTAAVLSIRDDLPPLLTYRLGGRDIELSVRRWV